MKSKKKVLGVFNGSFETYTSYYEKKNLECHKQ